MKEKGKIEKVCGFYVSNMHFATMILPFVNKKIKEGESFQTFFEFNLKQNINTVLSGIIANIEDKEKILKINWEDSRIYKYADFEKNLKTITDGNNIFLTCGTEEYIDMINANIEKYIEKNSKKLHSTSIKIINFFEVENFSANIKEILDNHHKVLNTSGEHEISEIFNGYQKKAI